MLAFVAAALFQKPVLLPDRAMRLDALLLAMSAATGERHRAVPGLHGRIELVAGPARAADLIRADLALANTARWTHDTDGWTLEEDGTAVKRRETARLAVRTEAIRQAQAKLVEKPRPTFDAAVARSVLADLGKMDAAKDKPGGEESRLLGRVQAALPTVGAVEALVGGIDPGVLAGIESGRVAFSDRPTRLQRPLGGNAKGVLREVVAGKNVWAGVFTDVAGFHESHRSYFSVDPRAHADPILPGSLRAILNVEPMGDGLRITGKFYDLKGAEQGFADASLEVGVAATREDAAPTVDPKEGDTPVSPAARAYYAALASNEPSPAMRALFLGADRTEPLDLAVGEGLRETAKRLKKPVTVWLDDTLLSLRLDEGKGLSPHGWLRAVWRRGYRIEEGASIVAVPRRAMGNLDRPTLVTLLRKVDAAGFLPFDAAAEYAATEPRVPGPGEEAVAAAIAAVVPGALGGSDPEWEVLRLWGGFTPAHRTTLSEGGLVPWQAVSSAQRERFVRAILQSGPNDIRPDYKPGVTTRDIDVEPSEVLAGPVGMGEGVTGADFGADFGEDSVRGLDPNETRYRSYGFAGADMLARAVVGRELRPNDERFDGMPKTLPTEFVYGRQIYPQLNVELGPTLRWSRSVSLYEFDARQKPRPLDAMPPAFLKAYREALDRYRKDPSQLGP